MANAVRGIQSKYKGAHITRTLGGEVRVTWPESGAYAVLKDVASAKRYITEVLRKKDAGEW